MDIVVSPLDLVFHNPDSVLSYYSETELDALQFEFDALDIESMLHDLWEWCEYKQIALLRRKRIIYAALRKQHDKAKLFREMQSPKGIEASPELLRSKMLQSQRRE